MLRPPPTILAPRAYRKNAPEVGKHRTCRMYDGVNLAARVPSPSDVLDRVPPPTEVVQPGKPLSFCGNVGPIRYVLREHTLKLRGSLRECVGGVQVAAVAVEARRWLERRFGVDLGAAGVTRLEVMADLELARPPCLYLPLLLVLARHKRLAVDAETVKFLTQRRSFMFYDKAAHRGVCVPGGLLRVELRYEKGGVAQHFGDSLTLARLAEPDFREAISSAWAAWYGQVEKGRDLCLDGSAHSLSRALQVRGLAAEGVPSVLGWIAAAQKAGDLTKEQAQDRRRKVLALARDERLTRPSPLIAELDAAVAEAAERMRA